MNFDSPAQERAMYYYETQVQELHALANRLNELVRPFSISTEEKKTENKMTLDSPFCATQLGRELDEVVGRFQEIINRIQP